MFGIAQFVMPDSPLPQTWHEYTETTEFHSTIHGTFVNLSDMQSYQVSCSLIPPPKQFTPNQCMIARHSHSASNVTFDIPLFYKLEIIDLCQCVIERQSAGDLLHFSTFVTDPQSELRVEFSTQQFKSGDAAQEHCVKYGLPYSHDVLVCLGKMTIDGIKDPFETETLHSSLNVDSVNYYEPC